MANPYAATSNILKIVFTKPQNLTQQFQRLDSFIRHPAVWPFFAGSTMSVAFINFLVSGPGENTVKTSPAVHRDILMELYKKEHGHYPH